ncbi:MAG TPA: SLBB domain-containing protein, partial [Acidimicrobiales bacterium]
MILPPTALTTLDDYLAAGGGEGLRVARQIGPEATIEEITAAGLRGRGGGGFPTGAKWASVRAAGGGRRYVVANGAEGEPATFKDRALMRLDPYRIVEGTAIAAFALGAPEAFVATKATYAREIALLRRAVIEMGSGGLLGDLTITIVAGPDEYLFGEEKALLEVIEGRDPLPRELPPWQHGLFATVAIGWESGAAGSNLEPASNPTAVNNVETLAAAAHILARGATWYRSVGTAASPGTILTTVVGAVRRPGVHEVELGTRFSDLLERCGGPLPGRSFKAALSGV